MLSEQDSASASAMSSPKRTTQFATEPTIDPELGHRSGRLSIHSNPEPNGASNHSLKRVNTRSHMSTVQTAHNRPNWRPGQEPGLDPLKLNGGRTELPLLHKDCQITVVDYSEDYMDKNLYDNAGFVELMEKKQDDWIKCRWINVNGLSWDVIQAVGKHKKLHRLSIEDMINTHNRTKVDWYTNHIYLVMTLQKLVDIHDPDNGDSDSDDDDISQRSKPDQFIKTVRKLFSRKKVLIGGTGPPFVGDVTAHDDDGNNGLVGTTNANAGSGVSVPVQKLRTLHRYHGGRNQERTLFMEKNSALTKKSQVVSVEQVSIFLTEDNTLISFFESSAEDIERPVLNRLSTADTILRRSCDASMLMQALVDGIIDLAIPVTYAYQDVIGALELDVLTAPDIHHTTSLYIIISEITTLRTFVSPIINLINSLRDHKAGAKIDIQNHIATQKAASAVEISDMSQTYLADVEDHIVLIIESLDQMRRNADGMIDLIFNRISAFQNESMKQLTIVTIIFLPLSFLAGYFGMNFDDMPSINHNEDFFWMIAIPVTFVVITFLMRDMITWSTKSHFQKRTISRSRKGRMSMEASQKKKQKFR